MLPLRRVLMGLLFVIVDVRVPAFDLLPDPLGWWIIASALALLPVANTELTAAFFIAVCELFVSAPLTFTRQPPSLFGIADGVLLVAFVATLSWGLAAVLEASRPDLARSGRTIGGLSLLLGIGVMFLAWRTHPVDDQLQHLGSGVLTVAIADYLVFAWFLIWLFHIKDETALATANRSQRG